MFAAVHRPESLFPRLKPTPLPPARRLPQERLLQLLLEARDAVVDRRPVVQEREVPHQAVLCLTYRSSKDAPGRTTAETIASRRRRSCASWFSNKTFSIVFCVILDAGTSSPDARATMT